MWVFQKSVGGECQCCGEECDICAYTSLADFATGEGYPTTQTPDGSFPFTFSGASLTGINNISTSDVISTSGYLVRNGCFNTGAPMADDKAAFYFTSPGMISKQNFTFSYEFFLNTTPCQNGGKHQLIVLPGNTTSAAVLGIGSWSNNFSNSIGDVLIESLSKSQQCFDELPPIEIPNFDLTQTLDTWITRTIVKQGSTVTITDGVNGPFVMNRCFFPLLGYIGMAIGPGVRIRNIIISI